jgi:hypothetical protein
MYFSAVTKEETMEKESDILNAYSQEEFFTDYSSEESETVAFRYLLSEIDDLVKDWSSAIRLNHFYAESLGWKQYYDGINQLLLPLSGSQNVSLGEEAFAQAIADWQKQQGFSSSDSDGVLGPMTWERMKPMIPGTNTVSAPAYIPPSNEPDPQNTFDFNRWHAQKILDTMNNGIVGQNFRSKDQLEKIVRGEKVNSVDPTIQLIKILPVIYHITEQAKSENYKEIIIGSFIREQGSDTTCTGHCAGTCIDLNWAGNSFENDGAVQMVIKILSYLTSLPTQFKKGLGFGMPLQGQFFGHSNYTKYKSVDSSAVINPEIRGLVKQLGIVFPDNLNHVHIQVFWSPVKVSKETAELYPAAEISAVSAPGEINYVPDFENYTLAYRLSQVRDWAYLLVFKVSDDIVSKLRLRQMHVQYAHNESYSNDLNVDFYRLRIGKFPSLNGLMFNTASLLKYIRINLNNLIDTSYADFSPYEPAIDKSVWESDNPTNAVLKIDVKGPDNASVVVSLSKPNGWRFSTVHTAITGTHPVSGHREFFIAKDDSNGNTYFVIKGLDMASSGVAGLGLPVFGEYGYEQADALWKSLREKIIRFINANGGLAYSDLTYSERVEWRFVYYEYKNLLENTFGKGAGSAENSSFVN